MWHSRSSDEKGDNSSGDIYVLATGWQPSVSQLALSSKFLPIINRMLELATRTPQVAESHIIGQPIRIPHEYSRVNNDDQAFDLDRDRPVHHQIQTPGIYRFINPDDSNAAHISIAVNLDPAESNTDIMPLEQLTAFDVQVGQHIDAQTEIEQQTKLRDIELESKQKLWKWLIVIAIGFLIVETWVAGRTDRVNMKNEGVLWKDAA